MQQARKARGLGLILVGLLVGMLLITPATAHFTTNTKHLGKHAWAQFIRQKVYNRKQSDNRYVQLTTDGMPLAGANIAANGTVRRWFNRAGGAPTVNKSSTGNYTVTFPGLEGQAAFDNAVVLVSLNDSGEIGRSSNGGNTLVFTANSSGSPTDKEFELVIFAQGGLTSLSSAASGSGSDESGS